MYVKLFANKGAHPHLWNYENFKESHSAHPVDWNLSGNHINYIIYEIFTPLDENIASENGLGFEVLLNYRIKSKECEGNYT